LGILSPVGYISKNKNQYPYPLTNDPKKLFHDKKTLAFSK